MVTDIFHFPFLIVDMVTDIFLLFFIMHLFLIVFMLTDIFLFLIMYQLLILDMITGIFPLSNYVIMFYSRHGN